ncbi:MAG: hypothetical protein ACYCYO_01160 [Bacilli bacterium]
MHPGPWSEDSVRAMPTEDFFSQLRALGIESDNNPKFARYPEYADKERAREIYGRGLERRMPEQEDLVERLETLE